MSQDSKNVKCELCDYTSNKKYNLLRHMERKHAQQNVNPAQQNVTLAQQNVTLAQQNVTLAQQNVTPTQQNVTPENLEEQHLFECDICYKIFNKQWILNRHKKKCTGITNSLICGNCNKTFASRHSKCRHSKTCKIIHNINNTTNNIDNTTINNNNTTNNTINNNTINNINILTYNPLHTDLVPITDKNIDKIRRLIKNRDCKSKKYIMEIIRQFTDYSLDVYQNRFVIKNNLRASYSKVHCGNNNWKHFMDSVILPKFTNSIIGSFQELIPDVCDKKKYKFMYDYVDEMFSHGDLKYNSDACKDYAVLSDEIRLKLYDLTKDMKNFSPDFNENNTELINT